MKIFFLTQYYFDLYKIILSELERQGHEVFTVQDDYIPFDPNLRSLSRSKRYYNKIVRSLFRIPQRYWQKKISEDSSYNEYYDLFLCIDGVSFHPYLLNHLKKKNPNIKTSLYLWDTNKLYDFFRYNELYDKVQSFDIDDAKEERVSLLPSYWFPSVPQKVKYKLFIVGSNHDDRLEIVSKIYKQIQDANLPSFMKVILGAPGQPNKLFKLLGLRKNTYRKMFEEWEEKKKLPYTSLEKISFKDIVRLIDESECILDTDMPIQSGATERVVWSLARGKKIISTNTNLKRMPFYNEEQIRFIDRNNPIVDIDFLKNEKKFEVSEEIQNLRIDKWIHRLIDL